MQDIISIGKNELAGEQVETVNARDLHDFLGVGKYFSNWIKDRIQTYGFMENQDFVVFAKSGKNPQDPQGGRPTKEYHITLDMAKELSMVERNDRGRQARRYFIACERMLKNQFEGSSEAAFPNLLSVVLHLQSKGLKIKKSKVYIDREKGELKVQPDGSVLKSDVEAYSARVAQAQDSPGTREARRLLAGEEGKTLSRKAKEAKALTNLFKVKLGLAKALGFKGNQAVLKANELVREETGIDCAAQCNATHLKEGARHPVPTAPPLSNDLFRDFVDDECVQDATARVGATVLYERFVEWFKRLGAADIIPSQQQFGKLVGKNYPREKVGGIRVYTGLTLVSVQAKIA